MARRLKAVTPVWEDVEDGEEDTVWVGLAVDKSDKTFTVDLKKYIRSAEVMVNPNKADDYHVKGPIAKKIVSELGAGWVIEGGQIVKVLPFKMEYLYSHPTKDTNTPFFAELRRLMGLFPSDKIAPFSGVCVFNEGSRPFEMKKKWLYVGIPTSSSCLKEAMTLGGLKIIPDSFSLAGPQHLPNGIQFDGATYDAAVYAPQTIYLKCYHSNYQYLAQMVCAAIAAGSKTAMDYEGGNITIGKWLESAADQLKARRGDDIAEVEKDLKKREDAMREAALKIKKEREAAEEAKCKLEGLKQKVTPENILKMFPALSSVDHINRDDPTMTVVVTKEIVINGVNLGKYFLSMRPETAELVITGEKKPTDLVHPNLYKAGKDWTWHISEDANLKIVENLASGRLGEATNTIIENLLSLHEQTDGFVKRLADIKAFQDKKEEVKEAKKRGRPKKVVEPAVTVGTGVEGDPLVKA